MFPSGNIDLLALSSAASGNMVPPGPPEDGPCTGGLTTTFQDKRCDSQSSAMIGAGDSRLASRLLLQSLETENNLLKSEVRSLNSLISDLQSRVGLFEAQPRIQSPEPNPDVRHELEAKVMKLQMEVTSRDEIITRLAQQNSLLEEENLALKGSVQEGRQILQQGLQELQRICNRTSQYLEQWLAFAEDFILQVLPTFRAMVNSEEDVQLQELLATYSLDAPIAQATVPQLPLFTSPLYCTAESKLSDLLTKMDATLAMLQQVVFAKVETMSILRNKTADENIHLQEELEAVKMECHRRDVNLAELKEDMERQRDAVRQDVKELQQLYVQKFANLEFQMAETAKRAEELGRENEKLTQQLRDTQNSAESLMKQHQELEKKLIAEEEVRARLIVQLQEIRREFTLQGEELAGIKAQQKLLGLQTFGNSISKPESSLVRMVDQLMTENNSLKADRERLSLELAMASSQAAQAKYLRTDDLERREVDLILERKVPDSQLTAKILRRNLQSSRPPLSGQSMPHFESSAPSTGLEKPKFPTKL